MDVSKTLQVQVPDLEGSRVTVLAQSGPHSIGSASCLKCCVEKDSETEPGLSK